METNLRSNIMTYADIVQWAYGMESVLKPDPPPTPQPQPCHHYFGSPLCFGMKDIFERIYSFGSFIFI